MGAGTTAVIVIFVILLIAAAITVPLVLYYEKKHPSSPDPELAKNLNNAYKKAKNSTDPYKGSTVSPPDFYTGCSVYTCRGSKSDCSETPGYISTNDTKKCGIGNHKYECKFDTDIYNQTGLYKQYGYQQ